MSKSAFAARIEALARRAIIIDTGVNGKMKPIPSYTVRRELTNEDGYWEGDGGNELLDCRGGWNGIKQGHYIKYFDSIGEAVEAAEKALALEEKWRNHES